MSAEVYHLVPRTMRTIREQAADLDALINFPFKAAARLGLTLTPDDQQDDALIRAVETLSDPENVERASAACADPGRKLALESLLRSLAEDEAAPARKLDRYEVQGLAVFVRTTLSEIDATFFARIGGRPPFAAAAPVASRETLCRQVIALGNALAREQSRFATEFAFATPCRYSRQQLQALKALCRTELGLPDANQTFRALAWRLAELGGTDLRDLTSAVVREQDGLSDSEGFGQETVKRVLALFPGPDEEGDAGPDSALSATEGRLLQSVHDALDACDASQEDVAVLLRFAAIALNRHAFRGISELIDNRGSILSRPDLPLGAVATGRRLDRLTRLLLTWPLSAGEAWDEARAIAATCAPGWLEAFDDAVERVILENTP